MKRLYVLHPFLFALFPVLFLYSHNTDLVSFSEIIVPSLLVLTFALMLAGVYRLVFRDKHKAGIAASVSLMLFFFYGRAYDAVRGWSPAAVMTNKHAYLLFIWISEKSVDAQNPKISRRCALSSAISKDEGQTFLNQRNIVRDPEDDFGYQCIHFFDDNTVLLGYHARDGLHVARIGVDWFYGK